MRYNWTKALVLLLLVVAAWCPARAQCSINVKGKTIAQTLDAIEKSSDYSFFYAETVPDLKKRVTITATNERIEQVLNRLFAGTRIAYQVIDKQVVLSDRNNSRSQEKARQMTKELTQGGTTTRSISVHGRVVDSEGEPVVGASVMGPGGVGAATDMDGNYTLKLSKPGKLTFRYIGCNNVVRSVTSSGAVNVTMEENAQLLDDVVVVGYGTQKRINLTGAVSSIDGAEQLASRPVADLTRGLQGSAPGLTVFSNTGEMGQDATIKIRGIIGSMNGSSAPLVLVDNVEVSSLQDINPDDVESVSVLKDAASSSIYGVKAAFGVVLITTKKAKKGDKMTINYNNNFSWRGPTVTPEIVKSYEGAEMSWQAGLRQNPNLSEQTNSCYLSWNLESIERMKEWERVYGKYNLSDEMVMGRDFDVIDGKMYFYRSFNAPDRFIDKSAFQQIHNLSIAGSTGNTTYNVGLGYLGEDGVIKVNTDKYNRYNASFGSETTVNKYVDFRTKLIFTHYKYETPYYFGPSSYYDEWYYLYRWPQIMPYGTYQGIPWHNAITEIEQANKNSKSSNFTRINLGFTVHILKGLDLEADYTYNHVNRYTRTNGGQAGGWNFWGGSGMNNEVWTSSTHNKVVNSSDNSDRHAVNALFRYKTTFGENHNFAAFAGMNVDYYTNYGNSAERRDLLLLEYPEIPLATGDQYATGYHGHNAQVGFFARVNYDYKGRYLLELNAREDGSSRFPRNQLWGFFPSFSAGWNVSEEDFFKSLKPTFSTFKLRGSYGMIGNQDVGDYMFLPTLSPTTTTWIVGDAKQLSFGLPRAVLANGFTWEKVTTIDLGTDLRFFNNKLGVSFDWYNRITSDIITSGEALPSTFGQDPPRQNYATLSNKGWELAVDFHHRFGNGLQMDIKAGLSDYKIKYTKVRSTANGINDIYKGKIYGEIWGYETDRLFQESDFNVDENGKYVLKDGIASQSYYETDGWFFFGPGDVKYKDLNGDGKITPGSSTTNDHGDLKRIGNSTPRYEYNARLNLDWKGVDLGIFIQGVGKRDFWGSGSIVIPGFNYLEAWYTHQLDYWTPENTNAFYPRLTNNGQSNNARNFLRQSRYLLNMAYCRLKNVTVGYTLPAQWTRKAAMQKVRLYASFENLLTFDHMNGVPIDPETRYDTGDGDYLGRSYPYAKTCSFGLQVTF